jgi:hypothetical protein
MTAPELLREQMPLVRRIVADLEANGYTKGTAEYNAMFDDMIKFHRWFGWTVQKEIPNEL